jgi:MFS family permease
MLPWATTYESLIAFEIILALGCSLVSGADISIVYDSLPADANRLKRLGSLSLWSLVGEAAAAVIAGVLVMWSFQSVVWAQVAAGWVPFVVSLFYVEPPIEKMPHESHLKNFGVVVKHLVRGDPLMRSIFINSVVWGLSSFCVVWLIQPYWMQEEVPLAWFGVLWAALMLVAAAVSKWTHVVERRWGAPSVFKALAVCAILGYFLMAFGGGAFGVGACALLFVTRGFTSVMFNDAFNWRVPSSFRSTANSMKSLLFRLSYGVLGPGTGLVLDRYGLSTTLAVLGAMTSVLFLVLMLPLCRKIGELHVEYIPSE